MWKALTSLAVVLAGAAAVSSGALGQPTNCTNVCSPRSQGTAACISAEQECQARQQQAQTSLLDQVSQPPGPVSYAGLAANLSAQCQNACSPRSQGTPACISAQQECMARQQQAQTSLLD
jgi:hypothetical protein